MNNRNNTWKLILFTLVGLFPGCNRNQEPGGGFLVHENMSAFWYYIPVKSINTEGCSNDFKTGNFKRAIRFNAPQNVYLVENFDTVQIEKVDGGKGILQIMPVKMEYTVGKGLIDRHSVSKFKVKIDGTPIEFDYEELPMTITKMKPLFCYQRKNSDAKVCDCKKRDDDPHDYLFKICNYLKSKGTFSYQPCRYKITEITETIYNDRKAIEVRLNCCYLGDRAYFDPETKELIEFAYGAE